jgi:hypothetical protein
VESPRHIFDIYSAVTFGKEEHVASWLSLPDHFLLGSGEASSKLANELREKSGPGGLTGCCELRWHKRFTSWRAGSPRKHSPGQVCESSSRLSLSWLISPYHSPNCSVLSKVALKDPLLHLDLEAGCYLV